MSLDSFVPYTTFGEYYHICEFIQVDNLQMQDLADSIGGRDDEETAKAIFNVICREITYPLDLLGQPSTAHKVYLFPKFFFFLFHYVFGLQYSWRLPNQTWTTKTGFCACTANLCTTLLRIKGIKAWTRLGAVLDTKTKNLLGFHAWTEIELAKNRYLLETTVHPDAPPFIHVEDAYGGRLDVTYDPFAIYNEESFEEDEEKLKKYADLVKRYV